MTRHLPLTVEIKARQRLSGTVPKLDKMCHTPRFRPKRVDNAGNTSYKFVNIFFRVEEGFLVTLISTNITHVKKMTFTR